MSSKNEIEKILLNKFSAKQVKATIEHFVKAIEKYQIKDWEGVALKSGKFVESVTKLTCPPKTGPPVRL